MLEVKFFPMTLVHFFRLEQLKLMNKWSDK